MKYLLIAAALTGMLACNKNQQQTTEVTTDNNKKLYEKSMKLKDFHTAITAIQMILLTDSTNDLRDSLPELYGAVNNFEACLQTNEEALKRHPDEERYKNIKVLCLRQLGDVDGQFALLKELFESTGKAEYVAQIASIQLATGNTKDALETINMILTKFAGSKDSLDIFLDETNKQKVPVQAAAWNMKGYVYMQKKDIEKAKECYFKALEIYPDFVMPKRNLEMIFARR